MVLLLLILSKLFLFAKKNNCHHGRNLLHLQELPIRHGRLDAANLRRNLAQECPGRIIITNRYSDESNNSNLIGVLDPLLLTTENILRPNRNFTDQPPSYNEVINTIPSLSEPPPPYASTEFLNVRGEHTVQSN